MNWRVLRRKFLLLSLLQYCALKQSLPLMWFRCVVDYSSFYVLVEMFVFDYFRYKFQNIMECGSMLRLTVFCFMFVWVCLQCFNVDAVFAWFGMYLVRWLNDAMKFFSGSNVFGAENFCIVSVYRNSGVVPSLFFFVTCLYANLQLYSKIAIFFRSVSLTPNVIIVCLYFWTFFN